MDIFRRLWWGLYPLPKSFWGFYVLGGLLVLVVCAVTGAVISIAFPQIRPPVFLIALAVTWSYWATATVGVWRSANFYKGISFWAYAAKFIVAIYMLAFIAKLINGGAMALMGAF